MNREIACGILEELGFVVDRAENGVAAIDKVLHCKGCYDVILMDIQMPVMVGYKATGEIRRLSDSKLSGIPIIAMTANAFDEDKQRCLDAGMNAHIAKPIDVKALKSTLEKVPIVSFWATSPPWKRKRKRFVRNWRTTGITQRNCRKCLMNCYRRTYGR